MTTERWNRIKIGSRWYVYRYRDSWGHRYYSFDGETWSQSKREAFKIARDASSPHPTPGGHRAP